MARPRLTPKEQVLICLFVLQKRLVVRCEFEKFDELKYALAKLETFGLIEEDSRDHFRLTAAGEAYVAAGG